MEKLIEEVADHIGVAVHGDVCTWNNADWVAHFNACAEIVKRLQAGGLSETTIRNTLLLRVVNTSPNTLTNILRNAIPGEEYFKQIADLRKKLCQAKASGMQADVDNLVLEIDILKRSANSTYGHLE